MDATTTLYLVFGGLIFFSGLAVLAFIAGRDIFYAFYRKFIPKGADIFLLNYNRQVDHFYKVPNKDGLLKLKGKPYVINPNKVLSLSDDLKAKVEKSLLKKERNLKDRIESIQSKITAMEQQVETAEEKRISDTVIQQIMGNIQLLREKKAILEDRLEEKIHTYYHRRRPMLLYIENDPVPKDMFEFYTEMDSIMIDNVVARTMTKDPKATKSIEQFLKFAKFGIMIAAGAAIIGVLIGIYNQNAISQIAEHIGITIKI